MELWKQNHIKYGLIMCGLLILCLFSLYANTQSFEDKTTPQMLFTVLMPFVVWYLGIRAKKKQLKNKMTFTQGVNEGFKISVVFGLISPFIFIFFYFLNPQLLEYVKTMYQSSDTMMVLIMDTLIQFVSSVIFGTVYGAIISYFIQTKKK